MNKQDILIRLLKDGHITNEEFKLLYEDTRQDLVIRTDPPSPFDPAIIPYWGTQDPKTGDFIGPTYYTTSGAVEID